MLSAAIRPKVEADVTAQNMNCLIIVSGLPRSGTSLAMQMLKMGGIPTQDDGVRQADRHNPRGYFEHAAPRSLLASENLQTQLIGSAIKITFPEILNVRFFVPTRIVFLCRDLRETLCSQKRMLEIADEPLPADYDFWSQFLHTGLAYLCSGGDRIRLLQLPHRLIIENPVAASAQLSLFLDGTPNPAAMTSAVDSKLYRSNISDLRSDSQHL